MLPQNRRLRHLQGIYLRNLSFTRPHSRAADDLEADLPSTKPQPLHYDGPPQLHHSHSSESLLQTRANLRRRSTTLANISPVTRQKQLEYTVESRAADLFFSLHCHDGEEPVYISEVGERAVNFNFRFFDLSQAGPTVTRRHQFTIKLWAKRQQSWILLLTENVDLRSLNYLGSLRNHDFPPNCLLFQLVDGLYCFGLESQLPEPKQAPPLSTSSYNALMKLSNLDNSIQDALATREALTAQINSLLERSPPDAVPKAQDAAQLASEYLASQTRALRAAQARKADLQASLEARRAAIREGRAAQAKAAEDVKHAQAKLPASLGLLSSSRDSIHGQRRRICEDLARIFPIAPGPPGSPPLSFSICGVPLPNTDYDPTSSSSAEDSLSAALGYVAHLAHLLQFYLGVPLPYPVRPLGSRSAVRDDISLLPESQRLFPLFPRGGATAQYRFDYAWFLLNKDVEALCVAAGLKVVDIRHTLPNLKYLLYVCSAGRDEVPERKRGGIRGLWAGRTKSKGRAVGAADDAASVSTAGSRPGSADNEALGGGGRGRREQLMGRVVSRESNASSNADGGGGGSSAADAISSENASIGLPFDESAKLSLRTKGLRENVGARA
ncbi:UV radiation resistance protein and autophagy-related subunit 14-domain-containing protein [Daldinia caldariorum]|uniref:UV radiation resistance protein and autophagy-related subunit 14-domain-containing protein n=1 Tax=Daldinia caldariorum TaxID=326644 RepID=UPI002007D047|nr:UV radiation resistance protein and autophagy-related subunit 14-domain-containing protein [Daldinia caldariorum]KAI1464186.1 UV radiation resistance protein and autophagy-related subunit 14-domain-containing protein [Daldinia caldariorum]